MKNLSINKARFANMAYPRVRQKAFFHSRYCDSQVFLFYSKKTTGASIQVSL